MRRKDNQNKDEKTMKKQTRLFDFFFPRIIKVYQGGQIVPVESKDFFNPVNRR